MIVNTHFYKPESGLNQPQNSLAIPQALAIVAFLTQIKG
jgi:hypothetical protein